MNIDRLEYKEFACVVIGSEAKGGSFSHSHALRGNEGKTARRQPGWAFPTIGTPETPVQDRYLDVGRNKSARRQQGRMFPAIGAPETPVLRLTRGLAYSGLRLRLSPSNHLSVTGPGANYE